jgi:Ca-activated chloride channel homolog
MNVLRFDLLPLAVTIPLLMGVALVLYVRRRRRAAAALGDPALVRRLAGMDLRALPRRRIALMLAAALALGVAAADPRWGADARAEATGPRDVVLVLDASNSMRVEDTSPNRLERQRAAALRIADALQADRIGLVVFAGESAVLSPPTLDRGATRMLIEAVHPEIAVQTGTATGAGIRAAASLLAVGPPHPGGRVMILISDGEPIDPEVEEPAALEAARRAARLGIRIHALGVGTARGGPVPDVDPETGRRLGHKTDPFTGATAISRLDETTLRALARQTRGSYHHLDDSGAVDALLARLGGPTGGPGPREGGPPAPRYAWPVALALLALGLDSLGERRGRSGARRRTGTEAGEQSGAGS